MDRYKQRLIDRLNRERLEAAQQQPQANLFAEGGKSEDEEYDLGELDPAVVTAYTHDPGSDISREATLWRIKNRKKPIRRFFGTNDVTNGVQQFKNWLRGHNCILNASDAIDPDNRIAANMNLYRDPGTYGYRRVSAENVLPGDMMQYYNIENGDTIPHHAGIVTGLGDMVVRTVSSNGGNRMNPEKALVKPEYTRDSLSAFEEASRYNLQPFTLPRANFDGVLYYTYDKYND